MGSKWIRITTLQVKEEGLVVDPHLHPVPTKASKNGQILTVDWRPYQLCQQSKDDR